MKKTWAISLTTLLLSLFAITATDQTNHFEVQTNFDSQQTQAVFDNQRIILPFSLAQTPLPAPQVLGDSTGEKEILVDLTTQRIYAYEGGDLIYTFLVSTGKWGRTPTGTFYIANKFRFVKMSGGSSALGTYYYLPNVPYTMFFGNDRIPASKGFSFHGTYWHDNFGTPMSHGCINMKTPEAGLLYHWADPQLPEGKKSGTADKNHPGTKVIIYGTTPQS